MLRKRVYPYEHMDSWKRINETLAEKIEKKNFLSSLNMENII